MKSLPNGEGKISEGRPYGFGGRAGSAGRQSHFLLTRASRPVLLASDEDEPFQLLSAAIIMTKKTVGMAFVAGVVFAPA